MALSTIHAPSALIFLVALTCATLTHAHGTNVGAGPYPMDALFDLYEATMCVSVPRLVRWVFENHFLQLNRCSVAGLKKERTPQTQLFFGATNIKGEKEVDTVFSNFCRTRRNGGLRGLFFTEEKAFIVGNVISVQWVAQAPFLAEPYRGSDAYVTCGEKMLTIVSTFDESELKFKPGF